MSAHLSTRRVPPRSQLIAMARLVGAEHDALSSPALLARLSDDHSLPRLQRHVARHERVHRKKKHKKLHQKKRKRARERSDTMVQSPNKHHKHRHFESDDSNDSDDGDDGDDEDGRAAASSSSSTSSSTSTSTAKKKPHVAVDPILLCPLPSNPEKRFPFTRCVASF